MNTDQKLDKISADIASIDTTLAGQAVELREHIRRTALLEDQIDPVRKHVARVEGAFKLIGVLSLVAGIVLTIVQIIKG